MGELGDLVLHDGQDADADHSKVCVACHGTPDTPSGLSDGSKLAFVTDYKDFLCHVTHMILYGDVTFKAGWACCCCCSRRLVVVVFVVLHSSVSLFPPEFVSRSFFGYWIRTRLAGSSFWPSGLKS